MTLEKQFREYLEQHKNDPEFLREMHDLAEGEVIALLEQISELKAFGWKYCGHTAECASLHPNRDSFMEIVETYECDCGLEEAKKVLE